MRINDLYNQQFRVSDIVNFLLENNLSEDAEKPKLFEQQQLPPNQNKTCQKVYF